MQKALDGGKIQLYIYIYIYIYTHIYIYIYIYVFYFKITAHHVTCKKHSLLTHAECYNILLYTTVTNTFTY